MDFRILGRIEVREGDRDVTPTRAKARSLLGLLLLHPNQRLATDRIIEELWGEDPPPTADKALQGHVSALRKLLGSTRIRTEPGGYRLEVLTGELDAERFATTVRLAREIADPASRARHLADALRLWRGEPLGDLADQAGAQAAIARLQGLRLAAEEDRLEAELALGRHVDVLPDLDRLVTEHPLHEGLRAKLMLALYRAGRQSAALAAYRDARRRLAEDLGIEPGTELQVLERQILGHDPALDPPARAPRREARQERKIVTVIVVEAVAPPGTDPEDLERTVRPVLDELRALVEQAGGRAEPLFANALLGMFGAPRAHDDDALRAVRTALAILEPRAVPTRVRGGIETGEALVTVEGDAVSITGQLLGAASRLQATAPIGSILVGPATHRATDGAVEYRAVADEAWVPLRAREADARLALEPPFVGRTYELDHLERFVARARDGRTVQLVTLVAEPGSGKSRLVRELRARVEGGRQSATPLRWLQARCLPYGNGLTVWTLGTVVREWAGILESDDAAVSGEHLLTALTALEPDPDRRAWLARSLGPLVGIDDPARSGDREPGFAAWQRLVEDIAGEQPLVVVFEDLHWADGALLDCIDELVARAGGVPLVVLCTARPELLDARPAWGAGPRNAATILLEPLTDSETARLLEGLLGRPAEPETIERASGNPLFAVELARLIANPSTATGPIPESLHAVIAAHLDTLAPDLKSIAAHAAVAGEIFWPGLVGAIGGVEPAEVEARLARLVANEVVRRRRRSTVAGQDEYEFLHALVRDVAYGEIPRRDRVANHRAAAAWFEELAADRPTAQAELAAHHYEEALALARRTGDRAQVADLVAGAVASLGRAGDGARAVDVARADELYRRALQLAPSDAAARGRLLARIGDVAQLAGNLDEAERRIGAAIQALLASGDAREAAAAMISLESVSWRLGRAETDRMALLRDAIAILQKLPPSPELVRAYAQTAAHALYGGSSTDCLAWSSRALGVAEALGVPALQFQPRQYLGIARFEQGDPRGIDEVRAAIALGLEAGLGWETAHAQADLGAMVWLQEGPRPAIPIKAAAAAFADDRGMTELAGTTRAQALWMQYDAGAWDELLQAASGLIDAAGDDRGRVTMIARSTMARVLTARGRVAEAAPLAAEVLASGRGVGDAQDLDPALVTAASVTSAAGDGAGALALLAELEERTRGLDPSWRAHDAGLVARICVAHGGVDLARSFLDAAAKPAPTRARLATATVRAVVAEADGDLDAARAAYSAVARGWADYGCPEEEAEALLGHARSAAGTRVGDHAGLRRAVAIGQELAAVRIITEARRLLAAGQA